MCRAIALSFVLCAEQYTTKVKRSSEPTTANTKRFMSMKYEKKGTYHPHFNNKSYLVTVQLALTLEVTKRSYSSDFLGTLYH